MLNQRKYFLTGVFVAGALLVLIGTMFFLGLADEFAERVYLVTTFNESVQGLSKGSAVKYKGVPIGQVEQIRIMTAERIIRVDMSIDPAAFGGLEDQSGKTPIEKLQDFCREAQKNGLGCRLDLAGITGMRYIEMDYIPPEKRRKTALPAIDEPGVFYFASAPGTFNNIIDSVAVSLDKIANVNIAQIASDLDSNLKALNEILTNPSIRKSLDRLERITGNVEALSDNFAEHLTGEDLRKLIDGVNNNLNNISQLTSQLNGKLSDVNTRELNKQIVEVLTASRMLIDELQNDSDDAVTIIRKLNTVLGNLNEFIDGLKDDPSSLVRGRKNMPVKFE